MPHPYDLSGLHRESHTFRRPEPREEDKLPRPIERAFVGYKITPAGKLMLRVCSWCPDKNSLETWAKGRDLAITHTLCPACYQSQLAQLTP